jgi:hypothetical protein
MMMCGTLPSSAITFNLSIVSELPTISSSFLGRYPGHFVSLGIAKLVVRRLGLSVG